MSVHDRIEEWLRIMGYKEKIPPGFSNICNPSTSFIWEQLIRNVKPRAEVRRKKIAIIANRLAEKPLEQQDEFSYPIKEIEIFLEKHKLEKRIQFLETAIQEKEKTVNSLLEKNKLTYVTIDNIKAKIRERQDKKFLLEKKIKLLQEDIHSASETLTMARNLTPVEMETSTNGEEVTKTLEECAEKLKKISEGLTFSKPNKQRCVSSCVQRTTQTPNQFTKKNSFSDYLNHSTVLRAIAPSSNKENIRQNVCRSLKFLDNSMRSSKPERKNRESLGLLPEACFNASDELDAFLLDNSKHDDVFSSSISDSMLHGKIVEKIVTKLSSEKNVGAVLQKMLYTNNRSLILNVFNNICQKLFTETKLSISKCNKLISCESNLNPTDLGELYFIHVKNELLMEKYQVQLKKMQEIVKKRKDEVFLQLSAKARNKDEILEMLELQIEDNYLNAANSFLRKEIDSCNRTQNENEVQIMTVKINRIKEQIVEKSDSVQHLISAISAVLENIQNSFEETAVFVKRLDPYVKDFNWANSMTDRTHSQEVEVFKNFQIEYNRKFFNRSDYCRDYSDTTIPPYLKLDSGDLNLVTSLMDSPHLPPEILILDLLRNKFLVDKLSTSQSQSVPVRSCQKYSLEELNGKESYVEAVINQLNCIMNSSCVKQILAAPGDMEEVINLWVEMPFRDHISDKRQVEGFSFKYYEKKLHELRIDLASLRLN